MVLWHLENIIIILSQRCEVGDKTKYKPMMSPIGLWTTRFEALRLALRGSPSWFFENRSYLVDRVELDRSKR